MSEMEQHQIGGHHARFVSCVIDHISLPNLVIVHVAVVGFIYFWREIKAFPPLDGRRCE